MTTLNPKMIRAQILAVAALDHERAVTDREIYFALDEVPPDERGLIREGLRYLADAGYVETEQDFVPVKGGEITKVMLTGKGLQLLRGERPADPFIDPRGYEEAVKLSSIGRRL